MANTQVNRIINGRILTSDMALGTAMSVIWSTTLSQTDIPQKLQDEFL